MKNSIRRWIGSIAVLNVAIFQSVPIFAVTLPQSRPLPIQSGEVQNPLTELPLSPGDRVRLMIPGVGSEPFNNNYVVNFDGTLDIPLVEPIQVAGLGAKEVEKRVSAALVQKRLFRPELLRVNVQLVELAPIQVTVIGAAFDPGRIVLNNNAAAATITGSSGSPQGTQQAQQTVIFPGSYSMSRYLTTALKTAGGVRPNANLSQIQLVRNGKTRIIDFSGALKDQQIEDVPLIAGDQIVIPDAGTFQPQLVRPSVITPSRIPLYVSNLTAPGGNSNSVQEVEYGTRLSQALIAAQCVGGNSSNSKRRAVLVRSDTRTGEAVATQRSVEDLTKKSPSVGKEDVYLMPRDGIACYDSRTTNLGSVLNILSNFFTPIGVVRSLFR
jgi:polysaccharide biosynthesis/export protein